MKNRTPRPCALCLQTEVLCYSHILPEFMYEGLYGGTRHEFISAPFDVSRAPEPGQKGFRQYLLCKKCEVKLSKYEYYGAQILARVQFDTNVTMITIPDLDYSRFKLFGLSLIWRSHISTLPQFKLIDLAHHADQLRVMLDNSDPGDPQEYRIAMIKITDGTRSLPNVLLPTHRFNVGGVNYRMFVKGCWIFFEVSDFPDPDSPLPYVGMSKDLNVPVSRMTREEIYRQLRSRMPDSHFTNQKINNRFGFSTS